MTQIGGASAVESARSALETHHAARARLRRWPFIVASGLTLGVLVTGLSLYQRAPDPMPVHWNLQLHADEWAPKSVLGFLAPVFIALGVVSLFWVIAALMPLAARLGGEDHRQASTTQLSPRTRFNDANEAGVLRMLEHLALSTSALIGFVAVASWLGLPEWAAPWLMPVLMLVYFAILGVDVWRIMRSSRFTV